MNRRILAPLALLLVPGDLRPQVPTRLQPLAPAATPSPTLTLRSVLPADLLPAGKTQGSFHLTGLVRPDRTVVLRWANDQGEVPTDGVRIYRQKAGRSDWKELTGSHPVGLFQGKAALKRLKSLPDEDRERILAYPYADVQHDPATRIRVAEPPVSALTRARDLSPEKSLQAFRALRVSGRLSRTDLQLMSVRADVDGALAEILGLSYTDDPGKGEFRYRIVVTLPEGGTVEAVAPQVFDTRVPTPVPQPQNLTAASGNGEVLLNWDAPPSEVVAGYNVYRADGPGGPWHRLNTDPVKRVQLELEDPELTLRRALGVQGAMDRLLRPLPAAARTPQKVAESQRLAFDQVQRPGALPVLDPRASKAIQAGVAAGRIRPGGLQAPSSLYTDSRRTAGNALQNEHTYQYKVTAVDIGGLEQPLDTAPVVAGTPKDLEPPQVPGCPMLPAEASARDLLRQANQLRAQDPKLIALDQAIAARSPRKAASLASLGAKAGSLAPGASATPSPSWTLSEAKQLKLSRTAATMPVSALKQLGDARVVHSGPDGSVAPTRLVWAPSPDADLQGYQLFRARGDDAFQKVADTTAPEWTDATLEAGQAYRYAVSAVDKLGNVSARSAEGRLEVSDSRLPGRLAIPGLAGQVVKDLPPQVGVRRQFRPPASLMASGLLRTLKAPVQVKAAPAATVTEYRTPKTLLVTQAKPLPLAVYALPAKGPVQAKAPVPTLQAGQLAAQIKPVFRKIARSFNPMLVAPAAPKEIQVLLTWSRPVDGFPMEYVLEQAPQRMELVTLPRPGLAYQPGFRAFSALAATQTAAQPIKLALLPPAGAQATATGAAPGTLQMITPALRTEALQGRVAVQDAGLRLATARKDLWTRLEPKDGPGEFTRVNDGPVTTERYAVTFPAEAAQYGGASFFFRVRAYTKEFGRTVAGPVSDPIEVRLPDLLAPPSPMVGAIDLQARPDHGLDAALTWTQPAAKDLAGVVVDRQALDYTLVDGEAQPGAPKGEPQRLTPTPVAGQAFTDAQVPPGYQRYTFRAVDHTGNASEPLGSLEVLVPGEPIPGAPGQVAVQGGKLVWQPAQDAAGYTVWRSFSGQADDWTCISGILGATATSFPLPAAGTLHLRVVARSASGMWTTPSPAVERKP